MIKLMKTDNMSLKLLDNEEIVLEVKGHHTIITADHLEELRTVTDHFWNANNLYNQTSEGKKYHRGRDYPVPIGLTLAGQQTASME